MENSATKQHVGNPVAWALAGTVGKWVGEKVVGGIFGAIGGEAFKQVLSLLGTGGPDLAAKLDEISAQLNKIQQSLDALNAKADRILNEFEILKQFITRAAKQGRLDDAMWRIAEAYGYPASSLLQTSTQGRAITLRILMEVFPKAPAITQKELDDAAAEYISHVNDIPGKLNSIHSLLTVDTADSPSLLHSWATELARLVNERVMTQEVAGQFLEDYFLKAVSNQLMGVTVHCVAMGKGTAGQTLITDYLESIFHPNIARQARAFVEATEIVLFGTTATTMQVGALNGEGLVSEFPQLTDQILLRVDLIAAALSLAGRRLPAGTLPSPSVQQAVQGIYGRVLYRPSQLVGGQAPAFSISGYEEKAASHTTRVPLACIDFYDTNDEVGFVLRDLAQSDTYVGHYFWPFPLQVPPQDRALDPGQRYGAKPALYPVFGDLPSVLAAGFLDVRRLYRGVPPVVNQRVAAKFPNDERYATWHDKYTTFIRHPFSGYNDDVYRTGFREEHIWKSDYRMQASVVHKLFRYAGSPVNVRIFAHLTHSMRRHVRRDRKTRPQRWDLVSTLDIRRAGFGKRLFHTVDSFSKDVTLSLNGARAYAEFDKPFAGTIINGFGVDLTLEPGDYELSLDMFAFYEDVKQSASFQGWQNSGFDFALRALSIERLPPRHPAAPLHRELPDATLQGELQGELHATYEEFPRASAEYLKLYEDDLQAEEEASDSPELFQVVAPD